ncbi:MAG: hypothetical protein AB1325_14580 [Nitrospirota bacterium]
MLKEKDFQKLRDGQDQQKLTREMKKATGLSSVILNTKTMHDARTNTLVVKQEKDIASAVKNRIGDWLKEKAYNATAGVITLTKKDLKTRTNEVYIQRENGKVEKAIQIQKTHIHKSKLSSDKSYLKTETITYRKDGSITVYKFERDLKTGFSKESSYNLSADKVKAERITKDEYKSLKQIQSKFTKVEKHDKEMAKPEHQKSQTKETEKSKTDDLKSKISKAEQDRKDAFKHSKTSKDNGKSDNHKLSKSHDQSKENSKSSDSKSDGKEHTKSDASKGKEMEMSR